MARNQSYRGTVELISGITPKNKGQFPLMDAHDVQVTEDGGRLDDYLSELSQWRANETKDITLSHAGEAADAKAVGDKFTSTEQKIGEVENKLVQVDSSLENAGKAADSKVVGDKFSQMGRSIDDILRTLNDGYVVAGSLCDNSDIDRICEN